MQPRSLPRLLLLTARGGAVLGERPRPSSSSLEVVCISSSYVINMSRPSEYMYESDPDPVPFPLQHPGSTYYEVSMRPSCFHMADATHPQGGILEGRTTEHHQPPQQDHQTGPQRPPVHNQHHQGRPGQGIYLQVQPICVRREIFPEVVRTNNPGSEHPSGRSHI